MHVTLGAINVYKLKYFKKFTDCLNGSVVECHICGGGTSVGISGSNPGQSMNFVPENFVLLFIRKSLN